LKEIVNTVLKVEKEAEDRLAEARRQAAEIKKECDRELAERTRIVKDACAAEYHRNVREIRRELEQAAHDRLEEEKQQYGVHQDLSDEPFRSIVNDVVDIIAGTPVPRENDT